MSLQIFILGMLCEGHHHPYDMKKLMSKYLNASEIVKMNDGTLYYQFESLSKKHFIEKIEVTREDNRPEKTTYGITDKGREALEKEIYASFKNFSNSKALYASVVFLKHADPAKIAFLIEEAIETLKARLQLFPDPDHPVWTDVRADLHGSLKLISEHAYQQTQIDLAWMLQLLAHVRSA